jgi:ribosomal protein L4
VLVIDHQENLNLSLASRNAPEVELIRSLQVTPYQLLNAGPVVFSKASIQALEEVLKK